MEVISKGEEDTLSQNNPFIKLKHLQDTLKHETALRDTFTRNKEEITRDIERACFEYYQKKIKIHELYENSVPELVKENYVLSENSAMVLPQCIDPLNKLMFYFRNDNRYMLRLLGLSTPETHETLANFIGHFCYENIFSGEQFPEALMVVITFLFEKEIDKLRNINDIESFLNDSSSFLHRLFISLSRKPELRHYLDLVLKDIVIDFENLNNKTNEKNSFIAFDLSAIKEEISKDKKKVSKSKRIDRTKILNFLASNLSHSHIEPLIKPTTTSIENKNESSIYDLNDESIDNYEITGNYETKNVFHYEDLENFFAHSGIFEIKDGVIPPAEISEHPNLAYEKGITRDFLETVMNSDNISQDMQEWLQHQINIIDNNHNAKYFAVDSLIGELSKSEYKDCIEKIILVYKYSFERMKKYIDNIIANVIKYQDSIPSLIKLSACVIDKLLSIKFPNEVNVIHKNKFILKFLFSTIFLPIINQPVINGLVPLVKSPENKTQKYEQFSFLLNRLYLGKLFENLNPNDSLFTLFNIYICEIMPYLYRICSDLRKVVLPNEINRILNDKENKVVEDNRHYNFEYLKEYPDEQGEHQSMCFGFIEFRLIYNLIKCNENIVAPDQNSIFYKTYKKMSFHENTIDNKIENDCAEGRKTFIFITKTTFNDKITQIISAKKTKEQFSVSSKKGDSNENKNEHFILQRVMLCVNTMLKHLNPLSYKSFLKESDNLKDFVRGLNKMIELEGSSELLKEKTLPLEWFGLYLQSNIENIPAEKKKDNYEQLHIDLNDEANSILNALKSDDSLDIVYSKYKIIQKKIEYEDHLLTKLQKAQRKFKVVNLFNEKIKLCLKIKEKKDKKDNNKKNGEITMIRIQLFDPSKHGKLQIFGKQKRLHVDADTLNLLLEAFPRMDPLIGQGNDLLDSQQSLEIPRWFERLFETLKEHIHKEQLIEYDSTEESKQTEELDDIMLNLFTLFHHKIYSCIFPEYPTAKDQEFYRKCFYLSSLKPSNFNKKYAILDNDDTLKTAGKLILQMDKGSNPLNKLESFSKAYEIIKSLLMFNDIPIDALNKIMICAVLQAKSIFFRSNLIYIQMYLTQIYNVDYNKKMLVELDKIVKNISEFNEQDLETPLEKK